MTTNVCSCGILSFTGIYYVYKHKWFTKLSMIIMKNKRMHHLSNKESFFTLVDCCGTVYKNNKYSNIERYQVDTVEKRLDKVENNIFLLKMCGI